MTRDIKKIILHCSASDHAGQDVEMIDRWHRERGWKMIGYHYFIGRGGEIEAGRPEWKIGAHCRGNNQDSLGICLAGHKKFYPMQFTSLSKLLKQLQQKYPDATIHGHNEFDAHKTCPVYSVIHFREEWKRRAKWNSFSKLLRIFLQFLKRFWR